MSAGTDMSAKDADSKRDNAAHGGCPDTTCSALDCALALLACGTQHGGNNAEWMEAAWKIADGKLLMQQE